MGIYLNLLVVGISGVFLSHAYFLFILLSLNESNTNTSSVWSLELSWLSIMALVLFFCRAFIIGIDDAYVSPEDCEYASDRLGFI